MTSSPPVPPAPPAPLRPDDPPAGLSRGVLAGLAVLALVARASALRNGFVNYDDDRLLAELDAKGPWELLTGAFYYAYKPVYGLWLWAERALFGTGPLPGHVASWALFAGCVVLAARVLHAVTGSAAVAVGGAALLAVHPVHAENVAWWAERKDVLSLALVLGAHLALRRTRARDPRAVPVAAAVLLALGGLAKGTAWSYALVLAVDELLARAPGRARRLAPVVAVAVAGVVLDGVTSATLGPGAVRYDATRAQLAAAMAGVHARYAGSLLVPTGLSADYPVDPVGTFAGAAAPLGLGLALAAVAGLVVGVRRRRPVLALGCALWVAGLAPVNNLWPTTSILRADRYLLLPAVGAYALVVAALGRVRAARGPVLAVAVVVLGVLAWRRGPVWADSETLWTDALEAEPASAIAALNRGTDRAARGRWDLAEADARRGLASATALRRPELALRARLLLSTALAARAGLVTRDGAAFADAALGAAVAAVEDARALERSPWLAESPARILALARSAVATALETRARMTADPRAAEEDFAGAVDTWRKVVADDPTSWAGWRNLGNLLARRGEAALPEAADALGKAVELAPQDVETVGFLVRVLMRQGRDAEAKRVFDAASRRLGAPRALRRVQARLAAEVGDPEAGDRRLEELLAEDPTDAETRGLLHATRKARAEATAAAARVSRDPEELRKALVAWDRALAAGPGDADLELGAGDTLLMLGRFGEARTRYGRARALARDAGWVRSLEGRAAVLEAVDAERRGDPAAAARALAEGVRADPPRLDVGFLMLLDEEVRRLRPAADAVLGAASPELAAAEALLRGVALLVGGDERAGAERLGEAVLRGGTRVEPGSRTADVVGAARLLRAVADGRHAQLAAARRELEALAAAAPDDPLVAYHRLVVDRVEAQARLAIAEGGGDAPAAEAARQALLGVAERAAALAARPGLPWAGPALLSAELDLARGESARVLARLNDAAARFPDVPAVRRGKAAVYQAMMLAGGERTTLLREAQRELNDARRIDPRDPRTALDLSQLYRLAGDLDAAAKHAMSAASVEPVRGPASRALAAILVEQGRRALEGNAWDKAASYAALATKADPALAAADHLAGDVAMARRDLNAALDAYARGLEKAPHDAAVTGAKAACHRQRGAAFFLWLQRYPRPKPGPDGAAPDPARLAAWDETLRKNVRGAVREYEAAVELEPDGPGAADDRQKIENLRALDPEAAGSTLTKARALLEEGEGLRREDRLEEAMARYQEAAQTHPDLVFAWLRVAELAVRLGRDHDLAGIAAVQRLRALGADADYPEVDLYLAELNVRIAGEALEGTPRPAVARAAAAQATAALTRYRKAVAALPRKSARDETGLARADALERRLAAVEAAVPGAGR